MSVFCSKNLIRVSKNNCIQLLRKITGKYNVISFFKLTFIAEVVQYIKKNHAESITALIAEYSEQQLASGFG